MDEAPEAKQPAYPYFLPAGLDLATLAEPVKLALQAIVQPAYDELVLAAPNSLERSTGASFVFLLTEEVLAQFELGRQMNLHQAESDSERQERKRALAGYLKLFGAKNSAMNSLLRLRKLPSLVNLPGILPPAA